MLVKHSISPIYNKDSKVLILGSIPSIISRKNNFFYANKQNRFGKVMSIIFDIECSSDSSIKNVKVNDIKSIVKCSNIKYVFCTGKTSFKLYNKYFSYLNVKCFLLPSPSSANATYSLERLVNEYKIIKLFL